MTYAEFKKLVAISKKELWREMFSKNRKSMRIKKEETVVKNLDKIFGAVLKISNKKGFQAMSMRDLSKESGMSMGGLYGYFSGKDELVEMLQRQYRAISRRIINEQINQADGAVEKLRAATLAHLYLSEALQSWFYFSFMEAKNLSEVERFKAVERERQSEEKFALIISAGQEEGVFRTCDSLLAASQIKAMLQDWYLKRSKYAKREVTVDQYGRFILAVIEAFLLLHQED